jgi:hypothetical protein
VRSVVLIGLSPGEPAPRLVHFLGISSIFSYANLLDGVELKKWDIISSRGRTSMSVLTTKLRLGECSEVEFDYIPLCFEEGQVTSVFSAKNNKTVSETLVHRRYAKLKKETANRYRSNLDWPVGKFLGHLKQVGDDFYLRFLNRYGDLAFCRFSIAEPRCLNKRGIYAYTQNGELKYIGRCKDSFKKRINNGYGRVDPKNCYLDGQATNCHLNALIGRCRNSVALWIHIMTDDHEIERLENKLIALYNPPWNISLKRV